MSPSRLEQIYAHFRAFCMGVGIEKPMAAQLWLAITDYVLKEPPIARIPKPPISSVPSHRPPRNPEKDEDTANAFDANERGMTIGELRKDGTVHPLVVVRHQAAAIGESTLTFRTCRGPCGEFLPIVCFSKQGKSRRAICKGCDNARRVSRRAAKAT